MTDMALVPTTNRQELEAMPLAERVALEDAFGTAHDLIRQLNDDDIARLVREGKTQAEVAQLAGCRQQRISEACIRLELEPASRRGRPRITDSGNSNGDAPAEVVDGEVVEDDPDDRPERHLPDEVADDALENLRTQTLRWFSQGRHLQRLMEEGAVIEPRSRPDKAAIKREATQMAAIARRLKGAF